VPEYPTTHRGPEDGPAGMQAGRLSVAELLHREGRTDEAMAAGRSSGTYRTLAVTAGIALVCAVVLASTAALAGPRVERALPATGVLEHITGPGVLRPDLLGTTIDPAPTGQPSRTTPEAAATSAAPEPTGTPSRAGRSLPAGGEDGAGEDRAVEDAEPPDGDAATSEPTSVPAPDGLLHTVTSFYQRVVTDPAEAYALLGPGMQGQGYLAFAESWNEVERVTVDSIRSDGPDAAIVVVVLERADGSVLRTVQRVVAADTSGSPRIVSARLLSASTS
jgi:hypothetical protein